MKQTVTLTELLDSGFPFKGSNESISLTSNSSVIEYSELTRWTESGLTEAQIMTRLLPLAANFARPPISNFRVGAVAQGTSGNLYFGSNMEFAGETLSFSIHAEQASINNAWMNGETGIKAIAINAPPCGYCRQFINELPEQNPPLNILLKANPDLFCDEHNGSSLQDFLPHAFGPADLDISDRLMLPVDHGLSIADQNSLENFAISAANQSYAPYSNCIAGLALETQDGRIIIGRYAENAAYNPSLSPMHSAISQLNLNTDPEKELTIKKVVLAEKVVGEQVSQKHITESMLKALQPDAEFNYIDLNN